MATCCQVRDEQVGGGEEGHTVMGSTTRTRSAVRNEVEAGMLEGTCSFERDTRTGRSRYAINAATTPANSVGRAPGDTTTTVEDICVYFSTMKQLYIVDCC